MFAAGGTELRDELWALTLLGVVGVVAIVAIVVSKQPTPTPTVAVPVQYMSEDELREAKTLVMSRRVTR